MEDHHDHGKRTPSPSNYSDDFILQMEYSNDSSRQSSPPLPNSRYESTQQQEQQQQEQEDEQQTHRRTTLDDDVLYPTNQHPLDNETVQADVLLSLIQKNEKENNIREQGQEEAQDRKEEEYTLRRQYTAKLDDLLENSEKRPQRRYSLYGENIQVKFSS